MKANPVIVIEADPELLAWLDLWAGYRNETREEAVAHIVDMVKRQHPDPMPPSQRPAGRWDWLPEKA